TSMHAFYHRTLNFGIWSTYGYRLRYPGPKPCTKNRHSNNGCQIFARLRVAVIEETTTVRIKDMV
ncbi:MAG: hypothetical protein LBD56_00440, partial [Endomicrobium sp.]|nr:hypothetical protein [Endomicrobium sp.]